MFKNPNILTQRRLTKWEISLINRLFRTLSAVELLILPLRVEAVHNEIIGILKEDISMRLYGLDMNCYWFMFLSTWLQLVSVWEVVEPLESGSSWKKCYWKAVDHVVIWIYRNIRGMYETVLEACTNPDRNLAEVKQWAAGSSWLCMTLWTWSPSVFENLGILEVGDVWCACQEMNLLPT